MIFIICFFVCLDNLNVLYLENNDELVNVVYIKWLI